MRKSLWAFAAAAAATGAAAGVAAWSRHRAPRALPLPHAVDGERETLDSSAGTLSFYCSEPKRASDGRDHGAVAPLLLVHSVNAAGSSFEMKPIYDRLRSTRTVYVMDLPGFGFSARTRRDYTPTLMSAAVVAMASEVRQRHPDRPAPDAIALSLSCEFLARAAIDCPDLFSTVGFISPTGFERQAPARTGAADSAAAPLERLTSRHDPRQPSGRRSVAGALDGGPWSQPLFDLLVTEPSIRFFLRRAFGSAAVDEALVAYSYLTAHQPGARHAPLAFLAGRPFSEDPLGLYRAVRHPAWMAHGIRGAFSRFDGKDALHDRPNWTVDVFDSGALPQFECIDRMVDRYESFVRHRMREPAGLHGRPCAQAW